MSFLGAEQPGLRAHPNCTPGSGDSKANETTGSHDGRRIGYARRLSITVAYGHAKG